MSARCNLLDARKAFGIKTRHANTLTDIPKLDTAILAPRQDISPDTQHIECRHGALMPLERTRIDPALGGKYPNGRVGGGGEDDGTRGEPFDVEDVADVAL